MKKVWIVEMRDWGFGRTDQWSPTVGCRLTRNEARDECAKWKKHNQTDDFRVRPYFALAEKRGK